MKAALTFSRRKISSNVFLTDVVPAPEEPVTEMIGCFFEIGVGFPVRVSTRIRAASNRDARTMAHAPLRTADLCDIGRSAALARTNRTRRACARGARSVSDRGYAVWRQLRPRPLARSEARSGLPHS